jgi:hypothetical protein
MDWFIFLLISPPPIASNSRKQTRVERNRRWQRTTYKNALLSERKSHSVPVQPILAAWERFFLFDISWLLKRKDKILQWALRKDVLTLFILTRGVVCGVHVCMAHGSQTTLSRHACISCIKLHQWL